MKEPVLVGAKCKHEYINHYFKCEEVLMQPPAWLHHHHHSPVDGMIRSLSLCAGHVQAPSSANLVIMLLCHSIFTWSWSINSKDFKEKGTRVDTTCHSCQVAKERKVLEYVGTFGGSIIGSNHAIKTVFLFATFTGLAVGVLINTLSLG